MSDAEVEEYDRLKKLQEQVEESGEFDITNIPEIQGHNSFYKGAALMRKWFAGPANNKPELGAPSTDLITMDWVLEFDRAKEVYDQMISEKVWVNDAAKEQIIKMLRRKNMLTKYVYQFGMWDGDAINADNDYINYRKVGGFMDMAFGQIDDLKAALATFEFRIVVLGVVEPICENSTLTNRYRITIGSIGIYVRDSFDFNDDGFISQPLGFWNYDQKTAGRFPSGSYITNSDFREWRKKFNADGDFLVFSDILYIKRTHGDPLVQVDDEIFEFEK